MFRIRHILPGVNHLDADLPEKKSNKQPLHNIKHGHTLLYKYIFVFISYEFYQNRLIMLEGIQLKGLNVTFYDLEDNLNF